MYFWSFFDLPGRPGTPGVVRIDISGLKVSVNHLEVTINLWVPFGGDWRSLGTIWGQGCRNFIFNPRKINFRAT